MVALAGAAAAADMAATEAKTEEKNMAVARYTQDIIDAMDADKNHEISKKEFLDFMAKEFDRLDVNHDGKLTQSEILNRPMLGQQKTSVSHR
jgi:Ca2+-binding EF-hand superfamily protein